MCMCFFKEIMVDDNRGLEEKHLMFRNDEHMHHLKREK